MKAAEETSAIPDARVAGDTAQLGIALQPPHEPSERVTIEERITIRADNDLAASRERPDVHRGRFPLVLREVNYPKPWNARGKFVENRGRAISRAVIERDDFEVGIFNGVENGNSFLGVRLFVVTREKN